MKKEKVKKPAKAKKDGKINIKISQEKLEKLKNNEIKVEDNTSAVNGENKTNTSADVAAKVENGQTGAVAAEKTKPLTKKQEWLNLIKFVLFSISAGVIQILAFTLFSELIFHDANNEYGLSYFIALALSVVWNFTFNRKFTFKSAKNVPIAMLLVLIYYCAFTPLSIWWGIALTDNLGWNKYLVLAITMVINFLTEYLWTRFVVYRDDINTAPKKEKAEKEPKEKPEKVKKEKVKNIQQKRYKNKKEDAKRAKPAKEKKIVDGVEQADNNKEGNKQENDKQEDNK